MIWRGELSEFKKYFEPYDIDEENAEAIIRSKCPNIDSAKDYILVGEIGEIHSIYQKMYQGHAFEVDHVKKEFGDLLWFIAEYCTAKGWSLDDIMRMNIDKLKERYPDGFKAEQSLHRKAGDI